MGLLGLMYFAGLAALAFCSIGMRLHLSIFGPRRPSMHAFCLVVLAFAVLTTMPEASDATVAKKTALETSWTFMPTGQPAAAVTETAAAVVELVEADASDTLLHAPSIYGEPLPVAVPTDEVVASVE